MLTHTNKRRRSNSELENGGRSISVAFVNCHRSKVDLSDYVVIIT